MFMLFYNKRFIFVIFAAMILSLILLMSKSKAWGGCSDMLGPCLPSVNTPTVITTTTIRQPAVRTTVGPIYTQPVVTTVAPQYEQVKNEDIAGIVGHHMDRLIAGYANDCHVANGKMPPGVRLVRIGKKCKAIGVPKAPGDWIVNITINGSLMEITFFIDE